MTPVSSSIPVVSIRKCAILRDASEHVRSNTAEGSSSSPVRCFVEKRFLPLPLPLRAAPPTSELARTCSCASVCIGTMPKPSPVTIQRYRRNRAHMATPWTSINILRKLGSLRCFHIGSLHLLKTYILFSHVQAHKGQSCAKVRNHG